MHETLISTTTPGQSCPGSNGNEEVLHIPQSSKTGTSPSDSLVSYTENLLKRAIPFCKDAVFVFYSPSDNWAFYL